MNVTIDLAGIKQRADIYMHAFLEVGNAVTAPAQESADDVPVLLAEVERLNAALAAVESLTKDTDGGDIDGDAEIPIGEIRRMLAETVGR